MKKLLSVAAVMALIVVLCSYTSAGAFREKAMIYLAQQTEKSIAGESETPGGEVSDDAETEAEDEYDDARCVAFAVEELKKARREALLELQQGFSYDNLCRLEVDDDGVVGLVDVADVRDGVRAAVADDVAGDLSVTRCGKRRSSQTEGEQVVAESPSHQLTLLSWDQGLPQ